MHSEQQELRNRLAAALWELRQVKRENKWWYEAMAHAIAQREQLRAERDERRREQWEIMGEL